MWRGLGGLFMVCLSAWIDLMFTYLRALMFGVPVGWFVFSYCVAYFQFFYVFLLLLCALIGLLGCCLLSFAWVCLLFGL